MNDFPMGYPRRDADFDVLPGFQNPPQAYGEVAFYWWMGEPLTRERLSWQLDQLTGRGISGLQINYAHSDLGGLMWGLSYPSEPPLFSEEWWDLFDWFVKEANQRGIAVSVSDYTLGVGQGWYLDEIGAIYPDMRGKTLRLTLHPINHGKQLDVSLPEGWISVMAYPVVGATLENGVDLRQLINGGRLTWSPPSHESTWQVAVITSETVQRSLDPMHHASGRETINRFFERFADHHPDQAGRGLNFFFSDELNFGVSGKLWTARFADEFQRRKGYELIPELPALWLDLGTRTAKVRLDYNDVLVTLSEESYFKPLYEWHQKRNMMFGCDHGGRGLTVDEFGDYFRTQRWNQAPGCDQPFLETNLIKNKVAASIAHLYERQRVWLEGFHSSGWGTSTAQLTRATLINYLHGQNLLSLHGLYYSTHGGWWEWAPPCNHFRMPYWSHFSTYLTSMERLSYLMSQGVHRCDVAILYPVAAVEAGLDGQAAVEASFDIGQTLYANGIDFDFIDFESLDRAVIEGNVLTIAGESFRVLVVPSMRAIRFSTLEKIVAFQRSGGLVLVTGTLPEASDRIGANDPEIDRLVSELASIPLASAAEVTARVRAAFQADFAIEKALGASSEPLAVMHRQIGTRELYAVYGVAKGTLCYFRTQGKIELWDMWTGSTQVLYAVKTDQHGTFISMPLTEHELQLIVFTPHVNPPLIDVPGLEQIALNPTGSVSGVVLRGGTHHGTIQENGYSRPIIGDAEYPPPELLFDRTWRFQLVPTLDNHWGDYRLPASDKLIGAEIRRCRYQFDPLRIGDSQEWWRVDFDDSDWSKTTMGFGPQMWKLGPLSVDEDMAGLEASLCEIQAIDPTVPVEWNGRAYTWTPLDFSWRDGIEDDPGHQGYHGLKGQVHDDLFAFGKLEHTHTSTVRVQEADGKRYYLWTTVVVDHSCAAKVMSGGLLPSNLWLNGAPLAPDTENIMLTVGKHPLLLRYDESGRSYCFLAEQTFSRPPMNPGILHLRWHNARGILPFDAQPKIGEPLNWYRFTSAPGLRSLTFRAFGGVRLWVDDLECALELVNSDGTASVYQATLPAVLQHSAQVAICIERTSGRYGGTAIPDPIELDCGEGLLMCGDWSEVDGLHTYSGGAWYRQEIILSEKQATSPAVLDLGDVISTALVRVNDVTVGTRITQPWTFDVSDMLRSGVNRVEICVYNTLSNHYQTIPSRFRGLPTSGLLGDVRLKFYSRVMLS